MAWLWGSSKPKEQAQTSDTSTTPTSDQSPGTTLPQPIKQALSREEQANLDLEELLKEIQIEQSSAASQRIKAKEDGSSPSPPIPEDISPDSLYPTDLSCRSALDYAMFCQSFGGQFVNVYRYGEFRSCKNHWADFWLCMRTRNWDEKDRQRAIQDHYRKKAVKWKTGPSSEDVWDVRNEPVRDAFQDSLEDLERKIEEWKRANPGVKDPWAKQQGTTFRDPSPSS